MHVWSCLHVYMHECTLPNYCICAWAGHRKLRLLWAISLLNYLFPELTVISFLNYVLRVTSLWVTSSLSFSLAISCLGSLPFFHSLAFPSLSHPAIAGLPWSQAAAATGTSRWGRQRKRCGEPRRRAHGDDVMHATQRYMGHVFHKMLGKRTMNVIISILIDNDDSNNTTNNYSTLFNKLHRVYTHLAVCQNQ